MRGCLGASAVEAVTGDLVGADLDWRHSDQVCECGALPPPAYMSADLGVNRLKWIAFAIAW